jgi:molybdopterin converting factor small subunit
VREAGGAALIVTVRLAAALRAHAAGLTHVDLDVPVPASPGAPGLRIVDVLDALAAVHPAVVRRVRDEAGGLRTHVNVFVGADNVRDLDGLATVVPPGAELSLLPAVSGG